MYDIVVADARAPRDGRFIEKLGTYNPQTNPATINFNEDKALDWVLKGAQPTDTVKAMLSYTGVMFRKHLQIGVLKGAVTQEQADARYAEWKAGKEAKISGKVEKLGSDKAAQRKAALEAEAKVNAARVEAQQRRAAEAAAANAPAAEGDAEGAEDAPAADATEEAQA